eukprot:Hpha_TRINITY_DN887_c0_g1::TRINITY_DN887_c0_g1_i1::g.195010::m.195010
MALLVYVTHQGKTLPVEVPMMATVGDLAAEVAQTFELHQPPRAFFFGGERFEQHDAALADIGVCPQSTLETEGAPLVFDRQQLNKNAEFDDAGQTVTFKARAEGEGLTQGGGRQTFCFGTETDRVVFKKSGHLNIWLGFMSKGTSFAYKDGSEDTSISQAVLPERGWGCMYNTTGSVNLPSEQGGVESLPQWQEGQLIGFERVSNTLLRITVDGKIRKEYTPEDIGMKDGLEFSPAVPAVFGSNAFGTRVFMDVLGSSVKPPF